MPDKSELLLGCAPITEKPGMERAMRVAINHARHGKKAATFSHQQAFDAAIAKVVRDIPVDAHELMQREMQRVQRGVGDEIPEEPLVRPQQRDVGDARAKESKRCARQRGR